MKVRCPNCSASYKLPAEKVHGTGTVKVRCKKCGQVIEVQPEADSETSQEAALPEARLTQSSPAIQVDSVAGAADGTGVSGGAEAAAASAPPVALKWYLAAGGERLGPFTMEEVKGRLASKEATLETLAWRKGLADWTPLGEFEEFRGALHSFDEDGGETQLMDVGRLRSQPSGPAVEPPSGQPSSGDGGLVWQRRETSVLFSVDDYKLRKGTRGMASVAPVEVAPGPRTVEPLETSKAAGSPPAVVAPRITLNEAEVRQVAEALARRRRRRRNLLAGLGIGAGVLVIGGAVAWWHAQAPAPQPSSVSTPVVSPAVPPPPPPKAPQPAVAQEAPAPAPAPAPEPAAQETARKKEAATAPAKGQASRETAGKGEARTPGKPPAQAAEEKPPEPAKPAARQQEDANALLAALSQGRERPGTPGAASAPKPAASGEDSSLPAQLSAPQISPVLRKKQAALQQCIRAAGLPLPFRATARITISREGKVTGVNASETKGASGCVEATLRTAEFPAFRGDPMTVPVNIAVE